MAVTVVAGVSCGWSQGVSCQEAEREREVTAGVSTLSSSLSSWSRTPAHGIVPPTFKNGLLQLNLSRKALTDTPRSVSPRRLSIQSGDSGD